MRAEVISLEPGDAEGLYKAVLKITDEHELDELVRKALERSVSTLNALELVRAGVEATEARAILLQRTVAQKALKVG